MGSFCCCPCCYSGGPADGGGDVVAEQDAFQVILASFGEKKINVIKEVRAITGSRLKRS